MVRVLTRRAMVGVAAGVVGAGVAAVWAQSAEKQAIIGTLEKIEGQMLTVQTAAGPETVTLASDTMVRIGSKTLSAAELVRHVGARVKVRYTETGGQKEAQSVTVASLKTGATT